MNPVTPAEESVSHDAPKQNLSAGSRRLLRCGQCGRSVECSASDLLRFTRQGWPKCCGQVMILLTESEKPGADDTAIDRPPLPS